MRGHFCHSPCFQNDSYCKSLILKEMRSGTGGRLRRQALDFSGVPPLGPEIFNKVIHSSTQPAGIV
jgi:hypothetical protein